MIRTITGHDVPQDSNPAEVAALAPGLYLSLFHGRTSPDENLEDWGTSGPVIGPLRYVHTTYANGPRFEFKSAEDHDRYFPRRYAGRNIPTGEVHYQTEEELRLVGDLLEYNGVFYGDWSVVALPHDGGHVGAEPVEDEARKLLRSLVADVRAMQHSGESGDPIYESGYSDGNATDHQPRDFFGPFSNYFDANGVSMVEAGSGISVEWPNLRILIEQAEALLKGGN